MNWDQIEANWLLFKGELRHNWIKLTDEDITRINGRRDELAAGSGNDMASARPRPTARSVRGCAREDLRRDISAHHPRRSRKESIAFAADRHEYQFSHRRAGVRPARQRQSSRLARAAPWARLRAWPKRSSDESGRQVRIGRGDNAFPADALGEAQNALRNQFGMLHDLVAWLTTPGRMILPSGSLTSSQTVHSCS